LSAAIDCVAPIGAVLGEGPVWDGRRNTLYWVDIKKPAVHGLDWTSRALHRWPVRAPIGAIGLRDHDGLVGAFKNGFGLINLDTGAVTMVIDPEAGVSGNRFNDGKVDPRGRFWAGSMDDGEQQPTGHLYRLDADHAVTRFDVGWVCTNGIEWSGDGRTLYFVDTFARTIWAYDFDLDAGVPGARRVFAQVPDGDGFPDGLTVDADDHVWSAHWGGARLTRYRPDGTIERVLAMPVPQCTSCCFGGPDLTTLFVTSAAIGLDAAARAAAPLSGGLFAVTGLGVCGRPAPRFAG
jgi:sugar lactone lactonase YvrE